jgi:hypothetical protein
MKFDLWLLIALVIFITCSKSDNVAGTTTDVNSGSITGMVLNNGSVYKDSVTVSLYSANSNILLKRSADSSGLITSIVTTDGIFNFDSLRTDNYLIKVMKDGILIGEENGIPLGKGEQKTVNITIVVIVNQIFNITNISNNQYVTINNISFIGTNGTLDSLSGGQYQANFTKSDTISASITIATGTTTESLYLNFVMQPDGTYIGGLSGTTQQIRINNGATIINTGSGSDTSTVSISGHIKEEAR